MQFFLGKPKLNHFHFDNNRSGALLAWDHFFPDSPPPQTLLYIQDRDLWKWELPHSKQISNALINVFLPLNNFSVWDSFINNESVSLEQAKHIGIELEQKKKEKIKLCYSKGHYIHHNGYIVFVHSRTSINI